MTLELLKNKGNIYLLNKIADDIALPVDIDNFRGLHPLWQSALNTLLPFDNVVEKIEFNSIAGAKKTLFPLIICSECSSTLDVMRYMCEKDILDNWGSVIAFEQTEGRGQMGRKWYSSKGNLFATVVLPEFPDEISRIVPLVAGIGFAEYLEKLGFTIGIKWPNDIIINSRKVGGILVESRGGHIWLGVGVNLSSAPSDDLMRINGTFKAASLRDFDIEINIIEFWLSFVKNVHRIIEDLLDTGNIRRFIGEVENRLVFLGQNIRIRQPGSNESYYATCMGLSDDGALKVLKAGETTVLYSAEILPE